MAGFFIGSLSFIVGWVSCTAAPAIGCPLSSWTVPEMVFWVDVEVPLGPV